MIPLCSVSGILHPVEPLTKQSLNVDELDVIFSTFWSVSSCQDVVVDFELGSKNENTGWSVRFGHVWVIHQEDHVLFASSDT